MSTPATDLIGYKDAVEMLGVGKSAFYEYVAKGEIPAGAKICGTTKWRRADIQAYIDQRFAEAAQAR